MELWTEPGSDRVKKDINLALLLFDLYVDVIRSIYEGKLMAWDSVATNIADMSNTMETYSGRFKKLPTKLQDYESFTQVREEIETTQTVLPLRAELPKDTIAARHWDEVMQICNTKFDVVGNPEFICNRYSMPTKCL